MSRRTRRRKAASGARVEQGAEATPGFGSRRVHIALAIILAVVAFVVFLPALKNYFLIWDDTALITANRAIRTFDLEMVKVAFGETFMAMWMPLTIISFAADHAIWGLKPFGFHLTNNVLHSLNAALVFVLASQVISVAVKGLPGVGVEDGAPKTEILAVSLVTAVLFAVHPLRVESVAWATERKDVLFTFFYLLSLICYLKYATNETRKAAFFSLSVLFAAFSMMSKPMAATLPMAVVLLDFYPLGRVAKAWRNTTERFRALMRLALEKAPFFLLALALTYKVIFSHVETETLSEKDISFPLMPLFAARNAIVHLQKMLFPIDLIPRYYAPLFEEMLTSAQLGYYAVFAVITAYVVFMARKRPYLLAGWLFYNVTLLPVSLWTAGADRFTYLPGLGLTILAALPAALVVRGTSDRRDKKIFAVAAAYAVIFAALIFLTVKQIRVWKDTATLWTNHIENASHGHGFAYNNMGYGYAISGDLKKALELYTLAIEKSPWFSTPYYNRAGVLARTGRTEEAIKDYEKAIELSPGYKEARLNLGNIRGRNGDYAAAIEEYTKALEISPKYVTAYLNRGKVFDAMGETQKAIEDFKKVLELKPGDAETIRALKEASEKSGL